MSPTLIELNTTHKWEIESDNKVQQHYSQIEPYQRIIKALIQPKLRIIKKPKIK